MKHHVVLCAKIYHNYIWFISIFLTSVTAANIKGISLNKLGCAILLLYLLLTQKQLVVCKQRINIPLLLFFFSLVISCICASFSSHSIYLLEGVLSCIYKQLLQLLILYIPLCILMTTRTASRLAEKYFLSNFILVVRAHCIFAFFQIVIFYSTGVSLNETLLQVIFSESSIEELSCYVLFNDLYYLRASGFNPHPSYFGILLLTAFIFDKNKKWVVAYFTFAILAFSRTSIIGMFCAFIFRIFVLDYDIRRLVSIFVLTIIFLFLLFALSILDNNNSISILLSRFDFLSFDLNKMSISSFRHFMFYPCAFITWTRFDLLWQLFGIGPRIDGLALEMYNDVVALLCYKEFNNNGYIEFNVNETGTFWTAESDFVGLLLGCGLIGLFSWFYMLYSFYKKSISKKSKMFFFSFAIVGLFYNYYSMTLINLFLICYGAVIQYNSLEIKGHYIQTKH